MNIDYNLYKIFLYLYEEKSISKTASKLYVSQPAISYSLKELESQLGYSLFTRNSKGIEPTLEAKELYGYISTAFSILNDAEDHLKNLNSLNIGSIRLGLSRDLGIFYLNKYIAFFKEKYPNISFSIVVLDMPLLVNMLEVRQLDIVIGDYKGDVRKDITVDKIDVLSTCVICDRDNNNESIEEIDSLILPKLNSIVRERIDDCLKLLGINITCLLEVDDNLSIIELVKSGFGNGYVVYDKYLDSISNIKVIHDKRLPNYNVYCMYNNEYLTMASRKLLECFMNRS